MPIITALTLYPIKSCGSIHLSEAQLSDAGLNSELIYDREWMVIDEHGIALTQRTHPKMALIQPRFKADMLELRAPGMLALELALDLPDPAATPSRMVQVWDDTMLAFDCGDLCATWFSRALDTECRLVRFHVDAKRLAKREWTGSIEAPTLFADGFPLLLVSQASLDDLNQKLVAQGRDPIPMDRFRPNIVISDCAAFEEDYAAEFISGDIMIKPVKPCSRCNLPAVDQSTGEFGPDPMDILQTYRANPIIDDRISFGMNCVLLSGQGQSLKVGQTLEMNLAF
ncbi:MAG: hypothetical protein RL748_4406 [Pseudomonadota bacterium]|jgi:uncharacterized protein YcbX